MKRLWAARAWVGGRWAEGVLLAVGSDGCWQRVDVGTALPPAEAGVEVLAGAALPGLVDAHSHAFQRAFAGLAERGDGGGDEAGHDDFWSWRQRMYATALRITPAQLRAIAAQLFVELLKGGYTQVCEFHYLQHDTRGEPYADDPLAFSWALAGAAADAGIGLTLLPVLYERAGFGASALLPEQRRFALDAGAVWRAAERIGAAKQAGLGAGLAIHSLRAAAPASIAELQRLAEGFDGPIHLHVAEQQREVDDCLGATGQRPVQWLLGRPGLLDARWQLVHATHVDAAEIEGVAAAGAGVVLCPSTEANLGDGSTDLAGWLNAGGGAVGLSIGSDSNATRGWREELRWLEYGQRLVQRRRLVAAGRDGAGPQRAPAERLFERSLAGGVGAAFGPGRPSGLATGARADLLVVDAGDPALLGIAPERLLDALVFSSPARPWRDVMVAGRWQVRSHGHAAEARIAADFTAAQSTLWADAPPG